MTRVKFARPIGWAFVGMALLTASAWLTRGAVAASAASFLERRFDRATPPPPDTLGGIIVLGGDIARVRTAIEIARRYPGATVILSGPGDDEEHLLQSALDLSPRSVIDRSPQNTYENALHSAILAKAVSSGPWILVTDGVHMPRAMGAFKMTGLEPLPWPTTIAEWTEADIAQRVQHELMGLLFYRLLGRTPSLIPRG